MSALIEACGVSFGYAENRTVLNEVDLQVAPGELVTLLGPNGAGKSTLLNCLAAVVRPQVGRVLLEGRDVAALAPRDVARVVAYVPQSSSPAYGYRVRDYVVMGRAPHKTTFQRPTAADYALVDEALERLGIARFANRPYTQLSGGERQLVNVCRAVVQQPRVILFDEPTSALDYGNQLKVLAMVKELSEQGYAVVMTTHSPDHPALLGGRVAVLDRQGRLRCGTVDEIMTEPTLCELYGARLRVLTIPELGRSVCLPEGL